MVEIASPPTITESHVETSPPLPRQALVVGLVIMVPYLLLLPFIERTWRTTGDEPHYLLTTHSLVHDGDLDLTNNYAEFDYLNFYFSRDIAPQVRSRGDGVQILDHQLGLPFLLAPAYALGQHYGVFVFQIILTGLLAALTFHLAAQISGHSGGALIATVAVILTPPLLFYPYLIYPELIGALLVTWIIHQTLQKHQPGPGSLALTTLALILLPWLNRRFVPLTVVLALLLVWAWRQAEGQRHILKHRGWIALGVTLVSIAALWWFNSQFAAPTRVDISAPPTTSLLWLRLGRGVGWLVDQQRGLLIYAPIYIGAIWGLPLLLQESWQRRDRRWWILWPFLVAWGVTTLAGGYWIAWELGPRFLIVALPALAPLLALAWRHYGQYWLTRGLTLLLLAVTVFNAVVIIQNPELPYKSSLPLYYQERLGLPFTEWLPDLAENLTLTPDADNSPSATVIVENGAALWRTESEAGQEIFQPLPLPEIPFGHYTLTWPMQLEPNLPPETEVARLTAKFLGGGQLFNRTITAADLPTDGALADIQFTFLNPNVDRWRTPLILSAVSTGQSTLQAANLVLSPQFRFAWLLPYLMLAFLFGAAILTWYLMPEQPLNPPVTRTSSLPKPLLLSLPLLLLGGTTVYLIYQNSQNSYTYDATTLAHFVGQAIEDEAATDGQGWRVDPAVDPPQKAIYGPFDFYEAGLYHVTFRMKVGEAIAGPQEVARLQVNATANFEELVSQPILPEHFSQPDLYHHFVLTVDNPRRQALSFEVQYTGVAPLVIDEVLIEAIEGEESKR